jgi:hypothetical protein
MLETPEQRTKLLKAGLSGKEIERLYIEYNNFRIVNFPILYELKEFSMGNMKNLDAKQLEFSCLILHKKLLVEAQVR